MSHHQMAAFFSGTDTSTLQSEGNDTNCFVSLIVNTAGTYCAAITRKVKAKRTVTVIDNDVSYEFFGEGSKNLNQGNSTTQEAETEEIQYFMLEVERHEVDNHLAFLDQRFNEIEERKKAEKTPIISNSTSKDDSIIPWLNHMKSANVEEQYLFDDQTMKEMSPGYVPDHNLIHTAVCKMITGSLILNVEKFDLRQWITRYMDKMYKKIFTDETHFKEWVEFIVSFYVFHFQDISTPMDLEDDLYYGAVATAMVAELTPYAKYPNIKAYIDELETLIV